MDENKNWESIKLIKNTKGYNWEIKLGGDSIGNGDEILQRFKLIDSELRNTYGKE